MSAGIGPRDGEDLTVRALIRVGREDGDKFWLLDTSAQYGKLGMETSGRLRKRQKIGGWQYHGADPGGAGVAGASGCAYTSDQLG